MIVRKASIVALVVTVFVASFVAVRTFSQRSLTNTVDSGSRVFLYEPGFMNEVIESASPDGIYTAAAGDAGVRTDKATGRPESLSLIMITDRSKPILKLTSCGDSGIQWREFGRIQWMSANTVTFLYANGTGPVDVFTIAVYIQ